MTFTVFFAAKGGSGTSVIAACAALDPRHRTVLVDLAGDLPDLLGLPAASGQGLSDGFASDAHAAAVLDLAVDAGPTTRLVPRGPAPLDPDHPRWPELGTWLAGDHDWHAVVDAGLGEPPAGLVTPDSVRTIAVTLPCYLSLQRAERFATRPDGVVLVKEPGRSFVESDIERSFQAPVIAEVGFGADVARATDAGLLAGLPGAYKGVSGLLDPATWAQPRSRTRVRTRIRPHVVAS
ncbi:hypothetical protein BH24ACT5_BH24ACT5_04560 [soil metagenome]